MRIRLATLDDATALRDLYAPYVLGTPISFETEVPAAEAFRDTLRQQGETFPWLVAVQDEQVSGYAYACRHRQRDAYSWSVEVSVYVDGAHHRRGMGRALYGGLLALLRLQGFVNAYAGIALPNPASVGLHETLGFRPVGVYEQVGYKAGAWRDVGWWWFPLQENPVSPSPPRSVTEVLATPAGRAVLSL